MNKNSPAKLSFIAWLKTDGTAATGLTGFTVRLQKDAGTTAVISPTITESEQGVYWISLTAEDTNCDAGVLFISHATANIDPIEFTPAVPAPNAAEIATAAVAKLKADPTYTALAKDANVGSAVLAAFYGDENGYDLVPGYVNAMFAAWPKAAYPAPPGTLETIPSADTLDAVGLNVSALVGTLTPATGGGYETLAIQPTLSGVSGTVNNFMGAWPRVIVDGIPTAELETLASAEDNATATVNKLKLDATYTALAKDAKVDLIINTLTSDGLGGYKKGAVAGDAMTLTTGAITTVQSGLATSTQATAIQTTLGTLATSTALSAVAGNVTSVLGKLPATGTVPNTTTAMTLTGDYDKAKTAASAAEVWNNTTRTLTSATGGGATAQEVWEYGTRTLTSGSTAPTATENAAAVWAATTRTLTTNFPTVPTVAQITTGVWDAASRSLTTPFPTVPSSTDNANAVITALGSNDGYTNLLLDVTKMVEQFPDYGTLATIGDVQTTVNTETVNVTQQTVDLSGVEGSLAEITRALPRDVNNQPEILASEKTVEDAQSAIIAHGDANWIGGGGEGGGATPAQIAGAVWNYDNGNGRTISGQNDLATADGLSGAQEAIINHGDRYWMAGGNEPDPPAADAYASVNDLYLRWGYINVRAWADIDNDRDPDKILARILWALQSTTAAMNKVIERSNYKCPLERVGASYPLVPQTERNICAGMAGEILFKGRQIAATNDSPTIERAVEDFNNWSNDILNGGFIAGVKGKND